MPGELLVPSPKTRPVTRRTSIRQSLNLASVSKAFADVINKDKDNKDTNKTSKRTKDSRRHSAQVKPSAPRISMGDARSPSQATIRTATPDSKASTRGRVSATLIKSPSDERPPRPDSVNNTPKPASAILTRAATLRSKNGNVASSSLPKYRPKSAASEQPKTISPVTVRAGTRRRFSSSDEDAEKEKPRAPTTVSSADKGARPISPLPQRAALKSLNSAPTPTPTPPTPTKIPTGTPTSNRGSPTRPTKTSKTSTSASAGSYPPSSQTSTTHRPSSSSSSSSGAPQTPKTPVVKADSRRAAQSSRGKQSSSPPAPHPESPSPATRRIPQQFRDESAALGNMSHISEGADEDEEDIEDVEILLAPVAKLAAPTPAMPRIQKSRSRNKPPAPPPKTPIRGMGQLPSRANMSYLSPLPPGDGDTPQLRPPQQRQRDNARNAGRGSILSWEQLASEASKTLGEDELEKMLADIPAPFRSGAASPSLSSTLEIPESPCLSALDSPTGYGSISQVLLPDVTPSPAMHTSQRYSLSPPEGGKVDSTMVTLLRLQLAQAENMAKERLMQMHAMEQEIHALKETHMRQMQETSRHIAYLEANERNGEEQAAYTSSLEDQLRQAEAHKEHAVREARRRTEDNARRSHEMVRRKEKTIVQVGCAARLTMSGWVSVRDLAEVEIDLVRGDRAVLSVFLAELDQLTQVLSS